MFDTYGAQVYGSAARRELGTVGVKCAAQGALIYLLVLGPYLNLGRLIQALPADNSAGNSKPEGESFQDIAEQYLRITAVCGYLNFLSNIIAKYLAIQGHTKFIYLISASNLAVRILLTYLLAEMQDMGTNGLGIAAVLSDLFTLALSLSICCILIRRGALIWSGFSTKIFENWIPMLKLGLSGVVNLLAEFALLEIATFLSQVGNHFATVIIMRLKSQVYD